MKLKKTPVLNYLVSLIQKSSNGGASGIRTHVLESSLYTSTIIVSFVYFVTLQEKKQNTARESFSYTSMTVKNFAKH